MDDPKSPIDSFSVSLGSSPTPRPAERNTEPWNILVCSDLGFTSRQPQPLRIAEWNDFVKSAGVVLSGSAPDKLTGGTAPIYVELPLRTMKDFTQDGVAQHVPALAAISAAAFAIRRLLEGSTSVADVASLIARAGLPQADVARISKMLNPRPASSAPQTPRPAPTETSSVDRILSMMNPTLAKNQDDSAAPLGLTAGLFQAASGTGETFDKSGLAAYADECEQRITSQADAISNQPFFALRKASWNCLMLLAKIIGRKPEAQITVFSGVAGHMYESFTAVLGACLAQGRGPDIVAWDYDSTFTNADMEAASALVAVAEQYKCMVIAPTGMDDPLFAGISGRQSIAHYFDDVRFLPYKKLRANPNSRCLCLCAPPLVMFGSANGSVHANSRSCWYAALRWAEMLIADKNPVAARQQRPGAESVFAGGPLFFSDISASVAADGAAMGLTLFEGTLDAATLDKAKTVVGVDAADESFTSMAFNLFVNRVIRRCGLLLLAAGQAAQKKDVAAALEEYVRRECEACGIVGDGGSVSAIVRDDGAIAIAIESETTVSSYPVRFSFSL
jgi:hypothetical protein